MSLKKKDEEVPTNASENSTVPYGLGDTKKKILWHLKARGEGGLDDLASTLRITRMAVHKHLAMLEQKGLVESDQPRKGRVGRPRASYRLTGKGATIFPKSYSAVATCALRFIERKMGRDAVEHVLRERQSEIFEQYQRELDDNGLGLDRRVRKLATLRDQEGYMADVRKLSASRYVMLEHNCPIIYLAQSYWEACTTETELFQNLLDAKVETTHRAAKGDLVCRFVIEPRKDSESFETELQK
jgi:predicted ArsR family transcriptional regulator